MSFIKAALTLENGKEHLVLMQNITLRDHHIEFDFDGYHYIYEFSGNWLELVFMQEAVFDLRKLNLISKEALC